MFEFIMGLESEIETRYKTLIRDIKSKSNSFYDAYLDLQEAFIKTMIEKHGIDYDESRTCGYLLRGEEIMDLFLNTLNVPKETYEQIRDRILKVNRHKHQKEKTIGPDSVVAFMEILHRFMKACCGSNEIFDGEYFRSIYGEYERLNSNLKQEKDAIVAELEDLVKEKRMTEEQLRAYQEALSISQISGENLTEQNDALLREISALKSLKLSILDQKLNKTIDMLNDLQEYVVESRAVSLAVGYTVVGKERIGTYIDIARKEMGRSEPPIQQHSGVTEPQLTQEPSQEAGEESQPANILDVMTEIPKLPTLSERIGEPVEPYIRSKEITILPDEKDVSKRKKGFTMRVVCIILTVSILTMCLFFDGWLKLFAILPFFALIILVLETIWYEKNMRRISNDSVWINHKAEIDFDEENHRVSVAFATECGRMTSFVHSSLFAVFIYFTWIGQLFLTVFGFIFYFVNQPMEWATTKILIMAPISVVLGLAANFLFMKKPKPWKGKYVCFKGPNGTLVYDSRKMLLDAWHLEKKR